MKDCRNFLTIEGPGKSLELFDNRFFYSKKKEGGYSLSNLVSIAAGSEEDILLDMPAKNWEYKDDIHMVGIYRTFHFDKRVGYEFYTDNKPALQEIANIAPDFPGLKFYYNYRQGEDSKHKLHIISGRTHYSSEDSSTDGDILKFLMDHPGKTLSVCPSCGSTQFLSADPDRRYSCIKCMRQIA